jgi:hypothetical protein
LAGGVLTGGVLTGGVLTGVVADGGAFVDVEAGGAGAPGRFGRGGAGRAGRAPVEAGAGTAPVDAGLVVDGRGAVDGAAVAPGERTVAPPDVELAAAGLAADVEAVEGVAAAGALAEAEAAGGAAVAGRAPGGRGDFRAAARTASAGA